MLMKMRLVITNSSKQFVGAQQKARTTIQWLAIIAVIIPALALGWEIIKWQIDHTSPPKPLYFFWLTRLASPEPR
jgi:hypothetical protein